MKPPIVEQRPAKGTRGVLFVGFGPAIEGHKPFFRVYVHPAEYRRQEGKKKNHGEPYDEKAWEHTDYEITHYDMDIEIIEDHAWFYTLEDGRHVLDYPPMEWEKAQLQSENKRVE